MSFQNTITNQGINVNVIPSFGRIVQIPENTRQTIINDVLFWRNKRVLLQPPVGFDARRYSSFSYVQNVQNPVPQQSIHQYVEKSRLTKRIL